LAQALLRYQGEASHTDISSKSLVEPLFQSYGICFADLIWQGLGRRPASQCRTPASAFAADIDAVVGHGEQSCGQCPYQPDASFNAAKYNSICRRRGRVPH